MASTIQGEVGEGLRLQPQVVSSVAISKHGHSYINEIELDMGQL